MNHLITQRGREGRERARTIHTVPCMVNNNTTRKQSLIGVAVKLSAWASMTPRVAATVSKFNGDKQSDQLYL